MNQTSQNTQGRKGIEAGVDGLPGQSLESEKNPVEQAIPGDDDIAKNQAADVAPEAPLSSEQADDVKADMTVPEKEVEMTPELARKVAEQGNAEPDILLKALEVLQQDDSSEGLPN